jgi:hypothetical protein
MPVEAFVNFTLEYKTGTSVNLKVFRVERASLVHTYQMSDIIQKVTSYVSQNFNCVSVKEITEFIFSNIEDVVGLEVQYPNGTGFTLYNEPSN